MKMIKKYRERIIGLSVAAGILVYTAYAVFAERPNYLRGMS